MINNERIVPIQKIDLLSLIGTLMSLFNVTYTPLAAITTVGDFYVEEQGTFLANQPARTIDFSSGQNGAKVYFVPAYNFEGIKIDGTAIATTGDTIVPDGVTLYDAQFDVDAETGNPAGVTITQHTPSLSA